MHDFFSLIVDLYCKVVVGWVGTGLTYIASIQGWDVVECVVACHGIVVMIKLRGGGARPRLVAVML